MQVEYIDIFTTKGPRRDNEDSCEVKTYPDRILACIADGVGGSEYGKYAADFATSYFIKNANVLNCDLPEILEYINRHLVEYKNIGNKEAATTFTGCIVENYKLNGVHVGDSRLCLLRGNGIKQLTEMHTEAARLYREKLLDYDAYLNYPRRNILESALGMKYDIEKQVFEVDLQNRDRLILSTDGFHEILSKEYLCQLSIKYRSFKEFIFHVKKALEHHKLIDNTSYIIIEF